MAAAAAAIVTERMKTNADYGVNSLNVECYWATNTLAYVPDPEIIDVAKKRRSNCSARSPRRCANPFPVRWTLNSVQIRCESCKISFSLFVGVTGVVLIRTSKNDNRLTILILFAGTARIMVCTLKFNFFKSTVIDWFSMRFTIMQRWLNFWATLYIWRIHFAIVFIVL